MESSFQSRDHDMLVTLNTKVDQVTFDIKDLKDSLIIRMAKAEARLDAEDVYHAAIPLKQYDDNSKWVDSFRSNYKLILAFIGISSAAIGGFIDHILTKMFHF